MSNHTPEPWYYDEGQLYSRLEGCVDINEPRNLDRAVACVNACAGINPEAVPDVVEALRELLRRYIAIARSDAANWGVTDDDDINRILLRDNQLIAARAALAKLEDVG